MSDWRDRLLDDKKHASVAGKVVSAVDRLLQNDAYLLEKDASERSITHRLAVYLESKFDEWHVDCEYNRDGDVPKRALRAAEGEQEEEGGGSLVLPDIIVHHRGKEQRENLLVIEAKKSTSSRSDKTDKEKLKAYKDDPRLLYQHALFLRFTCGKDNAGVDEARWV